MSVRFCSNECQLMHWQAGHMYECKQLASERNVFVLITPDAVMVNNFGGRSSKVAFRKPNDVNYGDPFTVKITFIKKEETLWIVDKTKQCEFSIYVGGSDISSELYGLIDKIQSQSNFVNEECGKLYVSAVFEDEAICKLYINQTKIKTW